MLRSTLRSLLVHCTCAVAIAAALASDACQAQSRATPETRELQAMLNRLYEHLEYRGKNDKGKDYFRQRYTTLVEAHDAWNASARSNDDARKMKHWLEEAISASMHGSEGPMPPAPNFSAPLPNPAPAPPERMTRAAPRVAPAPSMPRRQRPTRSTPLGPPPSALAWSEHPAMAELAWGDPFTDDLPSRDGRSSSPRAAQRFKPIANAAGGVRVDLGVLSQRVRRYNARLKEVEGVLTASGNPTAFRLAAVVRDLDDLRQRGEFLGLYLAGLSGGEAAGVPSLASAAPALRLASGAAKRRGDQLTTLTTDSADAERAVLQAIDRKLGDLRSAMLPSR